jgi:quinol monooxygenase YgiN
MIIYPIQSIESANGKLGSFSLPSDPNEHIGSMRVKAKKEHPLSPSHQPIFPLVMVALLAAVLGLDPTARAQDVPQKGNSMEAIGLLVTLQARPGKEADAEAFLKSAQPLAQDEKGTLKWYAIKLGPGKFGIFDTFANEGGRNAHLTGEIAKALGARANELFAAPPQIEKVEVLASTPLKDFNPGASAQDVPPPISGALGQVQSVGDNSITIQNKSGLFHVNITQPLKTYKVVPSDLNNITDNDYIGVASTQGADGTEVAKQIFLFPSELRGAVEGSVLVDPQPGSAAHGRMTNGSVSVRRAAESHSRMTNGVVQKGSGTSLVVRYQDGEQTISVPPKVQVVGIVPGEVQLAAGETAYAKYDKQADGTLTTQMILVIGGPSK